MTDAVTGEHSGVDQGRRKFLTVATSADGRGRRRVCVDSVHQVVGALRARAALGAPVTPTSASSSRARWSRYAWRGQPVYVVKRTPAAWSTSSPTHDGD